MSEDKSIKLIKAVKELNIGMGTIVDFLATKGYKVEKQPMAKLDNDMYTTLLKEFAVDKSIKEEARITRASSRPATERVRWDHGTLHDNRRSDPRGALIMRTQLYRETIPWYQNNRPPTKHLR